jgi:hypothetical protein
VQIVLEEQAVVEKEHIMSTIEVRLPEPLAKRLQQEALPPDEAIIKALEWWLEKRRQEQAEETKREKEAANDVLCKAAEKERLTVENPNQH